MSEHHAKITWERGSTEFVYDKYPRDHTWHFAAGVTVRASAAAAYLGNPDLVDPEEAFVASLSSCHLLTLLAIAARKRWIVESYEDSAVGFLEKNADGKLAVTRVVLRPRIEFGGERVPSAEQIERLHHQAHEHCFIANSVRTEVTVEAVS